MSQHIKFEFDVQKFVHAAAYLVQKCPADVTKMKLAKLLFFADKKHLLTYGRPLVGGRYIKMEWGPVPSQGYNLMKHDERASGEDQALFDRHLEVKGNDILLKTPANLDYLAETDREVLDETIAQYGHFTPAQLSKMSHHEPAWKQAEMNSEMDYRLLFTGPESVAVRELIQDDQELKEALSELEFEEFLESLRS